MNHKNTISFSVSLPELLLKQIDSVRRQEHSNRSEFIRTALRKYMAETVPVDNTLTPQEIAEEIALSKRGRQEYERGEYTTLETFKQEIGYDMDAPLDQDRQKKHTTSP